MIAPLTKPPEYTTKIVYKYYIQFIILFFFIWEGYLMIICKYISNK